MAQRKKASAATQAKKKPALALKNVPTTEFQRNYAKYLSAVRKGKTVTISYRGQIVAQLAPVI